MKRLRELMIENELTYQKLSDRLKERNINVTPDALRKWTVGARKPNVYKALDLAFFLMFQSIIWSEGAIKDE